MSQRVRKYLRTAASFAGVGYLIFGISPAVIFARSSVQQPPVDITDPEIAIDTTIRDVNINAPSSGGEPGRIAEFPSIDGREPVVKTIEDSPGEMIPYDSIPEAGRFLPESFYPGSERDEASTDQGFAAAADTVARDTTAGHGKKFLDEVMSGTNKDSLIYDLRANMVYIYKEGDVNYTDNNLKADYMEVNLETKNIYAHGVADTSGTATRPEFTQKGKTYTMDTIFYNIDTEKAKIKNVAMQEGEGYLIGQNIKKMPDNTINIQDGKYTTCDHIEHPHFYINMTKAKVIPNTKIITGPAYMVIEDVPIYFPLIPFGFFPMSTGRSSGFVMPSYGEEFVKGFFLRDGGYYFAFNDYADMTVLGGIYTLGSWEGSIRSNYLKKYKYSGSLNARFSKDIVGEKGDADYVNMNNFSLQWSHRQDSKARPNTQFSASVNFSTSGYSKYGANNMNDYLNTQTNSSISYSKSWAGTPFSLSTSMSHSQDSRNKKYTFSFPNMTLNMTRIYPFKRKNRIGKERWYEKISMSYTGNLTNTATIDEEDMFKSEMFDQMRNGMRHSIPVSTSLTILKYLNLSPSASYNENWHFSKIEKIWDPVTQEVVSDTTRGFYRSYDYSLSVGASTKIYGDFKFKDNFPVRQIRHVMTPSISFGYTPDFSDPRYGFYKAYQTNADGAIAYYSPYSGGFNTVSPPSGSGRPSIRMGFSLQNTLEAKVKSDSDTSGVRKIKILDNLNFSGSYDFTAPQFNLSNITSSLRTTIIKSMGLNLNATFDPYQVDEEGNRIDKYLIRQGKLARLASLSTSFNYSLNSKGNKSGGQQAVNDPNTGNALTPQQADYFQRQNINDPAMQRVMTTQYYDFSIPWNASLGYSFSYSNNGRTKSVMQTIQASGSVTPTDKWGITLSGGYDIAQKQLSVGAIQITRDLHCFQMNLSWVPIGFRKSWSFNISVKSSILRDLKYDKTQSFYDNLYDR